MECPPLTCSNPVTEEGDCCPRCEDDPCRRVLPGNDTSLEDVTRARPCSYSGIVYDSGSSWQDPHDKCTTCECKVRRTLGFNYWEIEESPQDKIAEVREEGECESLRTASTTSTASFNQYEFMMSLTCVFHFSFNYSSLSCIFILFLLFFFNASVSRIF